jgi:hypothetical protein
LPGAPFYRAQVRGGQVVLQINRRHRFYDEVYAGHGVSLFFRSAIEILLFVIGECELDANDDRRRFYESERSEWSRILNTALDRLSEFESQDFDSEGESDLDSDDAQP